MKDTWSQLDDSVEIGKFTWKKHPSGLVPYQKDTTQKYGMYVSDGVKIEDGHFSVFCIATTGQIVNVHFNEGKRYVFYDLVMACIYVNPESYQDKFQTLAQNHVSLLRSFLKKLKIAYHVKVEHKLKQVITAVKQKKEEAEGWQKV